MYVPPFESLLRSLGTSRSSVEAGSHVSVPASFLKLLLQIALANSDFDEEGYLDANPDVREAVKQGAIRSGHMHYIGFGYFEGRKGGMAEVDEAWYLSKYPDVATAVRSGQVSSATDHFQSIGGGEGRSPSADNEDNAAQWKAALVRG